MGLFIFGFVVGLVLGAGVVILLSKNNKNTIEAARVQINKTADKIEQSAKNSVR